MLRYMTRKDNGSVPNPRGSLSARVPQKATVAANRQVDGAHSRSQNAWSENEVRYVFAKIKPRKFRGASILTISRNKIPAKISTYTVPGQVIHRHQSIAHPHLEANTGSPILPTHFHLSTHSSAPHTGTANPPYAHKTQTWHIPAKPNRLHNCDPQGSAYTQCTRVYLTSTVSATLASLLFLNTRQLQKATITH